MISTIYIILVFLLSYLIGNISPATIIASGMGKDIKKEGSGNAGTTNVLRVLGKKAAAITLVIDIGKGFIATLLSLILLDENVAMFGAFFVFIGHVFPVVLGFKGGKGVATAFGAILAINPILALILLAIEASVVIITRYVSLASMITAFSFFPLAFMLERDFCVPGICMAVILVFMHRKNIIRLLNGTENKIFSKEKK